VEVGVVTADPQGFPDHWVAGMFRCRYEVMMGLPQVKGGCGGSGDLTAKEVEG
jgi:hypothetical protein